MDVGKRDFKYYIFDWDDNILKMPTCIHLEKLLPDGTWEPIRVSTSVYSIVRQDTANYRPLHNDRKEAFKEFQDSNYEENTFFRDTHEAIRKVESGEVPPCPSYNTFKKTLIEGRIFAIVTARGHSSETLKQGVLCFINEALTNEERKTMAANLRGYRACFDNAESFGTDEEEIKYYLSLNQYHAVTSPDFDSWLQQNFKERISPDMRKQFAIGYFVDHVIKIVNHSIEKGGTWRPISIGFSDDDRSNIAQVQNYIESAITKRFPNIKFCVYDTSDQTLENGRKVIVAGQLDFGFPD